MEPLGASTKRNVGSGGGSILSCCPRNPHGHERALKEDVEIVVCAKRMCVKCHVCYTIICTHK